MPPTIVDRFLRTPPVGLPSRSRPSPSPSGGAVDWRARIAAWLERRPRPRSVSLAEAPPPVLPSGDPFPGKGLALGLLAHPTNPYHPHVEPRAFPPVRLTGMMVPPNMRERLGVKLPTPGVLTGFHVGHVADYGRPLPSTANPLPRPLPRPMTLPLHHPGFVIPVGRHALPKEPR